MSEQPVNLRTALASFDQLWSPRVLTRVDDHDVRVAKVRGEHVWHAHDDTDEFFLVLDGRLRIRTRHDADTPERVVDLERGELFVVPRGTEHRPESAEGASILMFERTGTLSVGDRHEDVPDHVDTTTGHPLDTP
ncbi:cupin domain-containing protein [Nocardiopsis sp. EMB25]|uniref:cupin domain-containing protein n=1 Tax=Nocardiopsis TaxID=2013 RepID=UPI0003461B78|nr:MULTISPECIES: cupin domain-containing protein [Nocardiopsis]MCY9783210.1 cupin domain-containing protein [Nocardiopsis sp. EMB25]